MRKYLVHTAAARGVFVGEFLHPDRKFDLCINDWTGCGDFTGDALQAEYRFSMKCHKWPGVNALMKLGFFDEYEYVAFLDEDILISCEQINELFEIGKEHQFQLYQAALAKDSHYSHEFLRVVEGSTIRKIDWVEIMMPVFSYEALVKCRQSFTLSELGWGLEYIWRDLLKSEGMAIVDKIAVRHTRPCTSGVWVNSRGENAPQEQARMLAEWNAGRKE